MSVFDTFFKYISSFILYLMGWKIIGDIPVNTRELVAGHPHTSYWDGFLGLLFAKQINAFCIMTGHTFYFRFIAWVLGFLSIKDNKKSHVQQAIEQFNNKKTGHLFLFPDGNLKKMSGIYSGFYYIAKGANIPIRFGILNYKNKKAIFSDFNINPNEKTFEEVLEIGNQFFTENNACETAVYPELSSPFVHIKSKTN